MNLLNELDHILKGFARVFRREATFGWFVAVVLAFIFRTDIAGVTSFVRALNLSPNEYYNLLHFFYATSYSVYDLCRCWLQILLAKAPVVELRGRPVFIADDIKVAKEGKKMPGVKLHHQESDDNSKPEYIMGHLWGALGLLVRAGKYIFAIPAILKIHDGYWRSPAQKTSTLEKTSTLASTFITSPFYMIGDAFFTTKDLLAHLVGCGSHYIGRARSTTTAYQEFQPPCHKSSRGRPRKKGEKVKLRKFFDQIHLFQKASLELYGGIKNVLYYHIDLFWYDLQHKVRFVLTIYPDDKKVILLSTDTTLTPEEIIIAYSWRYRVESTFKALVHLIAGFAYHFWLKTMKKISRRDKGQYLHKADESYRTKFLQKIDAYERFVNIGAIALGILQLLSLQLGNYIWAHFPYWLRTSNKDQPPSEMVTRITLQYLFYKNFVKSKPHLLFAKILGRKKAFRDPPSTIVGIAA